MFLWLFGLFVVAFLIYVLYTAVEFGIVEREVNKKFKQSNH